MSTISKSHDRLHIGILPDLDTMVLSVDTNSGVVDKALFIEREFISQSNPEFFVIRHVEDGVALIFLEGQERMKRVLLTHDEYDWLVRTIGQYRAGLLR